jgi:hypothetical protein
MLCISQKTTLTSDLSPTRQLLLAKIYPQSDIIQNICREVRRREREKDRYREREMNRKINKK